MNTTLSNLSNKNIILGITGGISAYKSAYLTRNLRQWDAQVRVVMTQSAKDFVAPLTFAALSNQPVYDKLLDPQAEAAMGHIMLARWADIVLIAPASADFIARLAHGHANDLLTTLCLATTAPIWVAPAMNRIMWQAKATQANIRLLKQHGITCLGPEYGEQACGESGAGRLIEVDTLLQHLNAHFNSPVLQGKHVLITAGPTQEAIDPVRFISNHSSGMMGYALAQAAVQAGAKVTLICGPTTLTPPPVHHCISVTSAIDMHTAVMTHVAHCDIFISTAAVADYRIKDPFTQKIKKTASSRDLTLTFVPNPDILKSVAALDKPPFTVGFAAETEHLLEHASKKRQDKGIDMICANLVNQPDVGFNRPDNTLTVISAEGHTILPKAPKQVIANKVIQLIGQHYDAKYHSSKNSK